VNKVRQISSFVAMLVLATFSTLTRAEITSIAGDFTEERQKAWIELAKAITYEANTETQSMYSYVSGLQRACEGATGKVMDMHAPNSIAMQILGFCTAVKDMETERKFNADGKKKSFLSGAPAYCGDLDQGINHFESMPNTADYALIYPTAQELALAAKKIKTIEFTFIPDYKGVASFIGMDMRPKPVIVKCN
jgi:hypothetical protein